MYVIQTIVSSCLSVKILETQNKNIDCSCDPGNAKSQPLNSLKISQFSFVYSNLLSLKCCRQSRNAF